MRYNCNRQDDSNPVPPVSEATALPTVQVPIFLLRFETCTVRLKLKNYDQNAADADNINNVDDDDERNSKKNISFKFNFDFFVPTRSLGLRFT